MKKRSTLNAQLSTRLGHFDFLQNLLNHLLGGQVFRFRLVGQRDAVAEHVVGDGLHVLGSDEAAVAQESVRASRQVQINRRARGGAVLDVAGHLFQTRRGRVARSEYYTNYIILYLGV